MDGARGPELRAEVAERWRLVRRRRQGPGGGQVRAPAWPGNTRWSFWKPRDGKLGAEATRRHGNRRASPHALGAAQGKLCVSLVFVTTPEAGPDTGSAY